MLQESDGNRLVIDFMRRLYPISSATVVLPYYPVVNDMVMVKGAARNDIWNARVVSYNLARKSIVGRFFVKEEKSGFQNMVHIIRTYLPVSLVLQMAVGLESLTDGKNTRSLVFLETVLCTHT